MKFLPIIIILISTQSLAQLSEFNQQRRKTDQHLMIGLGSWASLNLVSSSVGWATAPNQEMKYFHQMNVMWNTVNLALAIPGYIKARKHSSNLSFAQTIDEQRKTETVFLFNAGLDIAYMSTGLILKSESKHNIGKSDLFNGYGNSLLMQGGFLFIFDWIAFSIHRKHSKKSLSPLLNRIELSDNGFGLKLKLD
jgi:hypothetical protein